MPLHAKCNPLVHMKLDRADESGCRVASTLFLRHVVRSHQDLYFRLSAMAAGQPQVLQMCPSWPTCAIVGIPGMTPRLGLHDTVVASPATQRSRAHRLATGRATGRPVTREIIGLDLQMHARVSAVDQSRRWHDHGPPIATSRERVTVLGARPQARILFEARTEREWVARRLESLGHELIVADPDDAPMDGTRSRRK